jgi:hypothetical protein
VGVEDGLAEAPALGATLGLGLGAGESDALGDADPDGLGESVPLGDSDGVDVPLALGEPLGVGDGVSEGIGDGEPDGPGDGVALVPGSFVPFAPSCPPVGSLKGRGSPVRPDGRSSAFVAPRLPTTAARLACVVDPTGALASAGRADGIDAAEGTTSGIDGAAARVGKGSSSISGCARMRSTSAADSTWTGSSATTCRTAPTEVSPTPAAPAATAAQAARGIHRGVMSHIVPL